MQDERTSAPGAPEMEVNRRSNDLMQQTGNVDLFQSSEPAFDPIPGWAPQQRYEYTFQDSQEQYGLSPSTTNAYLGAAGQPYLGSNQDYEQKCPCKGCTRAGSLYQNHSFGRLDLAKLDDDLRNFGTGYFSNLVNTNVEGSSPQSTTMTLMNDHHPATERHNHSSWWVPSLPTQVANPNPSPPASSFQLPPSISTITHVQGDVFFDDKGEVFSKRPLPITNKYPHKRRRPARARSSMSSGDDHSPRPAQRPRIFNSYDCQMTVEPDMLRPMRRFDATPAHGWGDPMSLPADHRLKYGPGAQQKVWGRRGRG